MKKVKYNNKTIPLPYSGMAVAKDYNEIVKVSNRFTGESVELPSFAVSVYDVIIGCEMMQMYSKQATGLAWFRKYFPNEYMIILD